MRVVRVPEQSLPDLQEGLGVLADIGRPERVADEGTVWIAVRALLALVVLDLRAHARGALDRHVTRALEDAPRHLGIAAVRRCRRTSGFAELPGVVQELVVLERRIVNVRGREKSKRRARLAGVLADHARRIVVDLDAAEIRCQGRRRRGLLNRFVVWPADPRAWHERAGHERAKVRLELRVRRRRQRLEQLGVAVLVELLAETVVVGDEIRDG